MGNKRTKPKVAPVVKAQLTPTMHYVVPKQQQDAWRGYKRTNSRYSAYGVFATADAAWQYIADTNRRLCATVVTL